MVFKNPPRRVYVNEVAVRDGLQSEPAFLPTGSIDGVGASIPYRSTGEAT